MTGKIINLDAYRGQVCSEILHEISVVDGRVEVTWTFPDGTVATDFFDGNGAMDFGCELQEAGIDAGGTGDTGGLLLTPPALLGRFQKALGLFGKQVGEPPTRARSAFVAELVRRGLESMEKEMGIR